MDALRALTPASRRIVLIDVGTFRTALESLRPALAQGRLDTFLLIPQGPRDEEFHAASRSTSPTGAGRRHHPRWSTCGSSTTAPSRR